MFRRCNVFCLTASRVGVSCCGSRDLGNDVLTRMGHAFRGSDHILLWMDGTCSCLDDSFNCLDGAYLCLEDFSEVPNCQYNCLYDTYKCLDNAYSCLDCFLQVPSDTYKCPKGRYICLDDIFEVLIGTYNCLEGFWEVTGSAYNCLDGGYNGNSHGFGGSRDSRKGNPQVGIGFQKI